MDRELRISRAISEASTRGVRGAAKWETVPRSTLRDRIGGAQPTRLQHQKYLSLTPQQEQELIDLILIRERYSQPLLKKEIHEYAQHLAELNGCGSHLGKNWVNRFFKRHNSVMLKPSRLISVARKKSVKEEGLREYYEGLRRLIIDLSIGTDRMHNLDETGVQEGETIAGIVAGTVLTSSSEKIQSDASAWISILETISADGRRLTPTVIFTGLSLQGQYFPRDIPDWKFTCSEKGWSNTEILLRWFYDVYLPETRPKDPSSWRLLVLDQHKTHISPVFMKKAMMNKVWLSWLPSHSSHITQPLDLGLFSPLKRYYREETAGMETYEATSNRQKHIFVQAYKIASEKAFSPENIRQAFRASGIYPVDVDQAIKRLKPKERRGPTFQPPTTPPITVEVDRDIFNTPSSSRDIERLLQRVDWSSGNAERDVRMILRKAGKSLDQRGASTVFQEQKIAVQKAQIAGLKPSGRCKVNWDPNKAFPHVDNLIIARDRSEMNTWKLNDEAAAENRPPKRRKKQSVEQEFFSQYLKS
jgi:4-hydroxybenzoate polyprenyltransferase